MIERCLEDLERRLDPQVEEALLAAWQTFCDGRFTGEIFSPRRARAMPPAFEWPEITVNEALEDPDAMALQQLGVCSEALAQGSGSVLNVRANYGSGILPSVFGAPIAVMDPAMRTLPTALPIEGGGLAAARGLLRRGAPDLESGYGARVFAATRHVQRAMQPYPLVSRYVLQYHPDLQGPMDVCELLWGSALFLDIVDEPALVHEVLALITDTYTRFLRRWLELVPWRGPYSSHWGWRMRGLLMLRDDSAMNFSPEIYGEFIQPCNQRLLREFGGGCIHFCGRGSHYIARLAGCAGLSGVQLSQPSYNDMETVYRHTLDRGLLLLGLARETAEAALRAGRPLHSRVHCA